MNAHQILHIAEAKGWTRCIRVDFGSEELELFVADDVDLDGLFAGICAVTGETLQLRGWLIASVEG